MKRAFTIIEILVILVILAFVAGLLFPVFSAAKSAGKDTHSAVQLSQIGRALHLYAADYDDHVPFTLDLSIKTRVVNGLMDADKLGKTSVLLSIKEALLPYGITESLWKSPVDPGDRILSRNSVYQLDGSSYPYLANHPCTGAFSSLSDPSSSSPIREGFTRHSRAYSYRADGSVRFSPWQVTSEELGRLDTEFNCDSQGIGWY